LGIFRTFLANFVEWVLPRRSVNKGKKRKGRGFLETPAPV
jgi:hypothetical protein